MEQNKSQHLKPGQHLIRRKRKRWLRLAPLIFCTVLVLFSGFQVYSILRDRKQSEALNDTLREQVVTPVTPVIPLTLNTSVPSTDDSTEGATADPTESTDQSPPLEPAPIEVDFDLLLEQNSDVVGWLYCPDTVINYPVVQGEDNQYYVGRLLNRQWNPGGTLFLDYRSERDFSHFNSVIYGHSMKDKSMFAMLLEYKDSEYLAEHPVMYLLTPEQNYKIEILGGVVTTMDDPAYQSTGTQDERNTLLSKVCPAGVELPADARLLTMSTCTYEFTDARYLLVGVMQEIA